MSTVNMKSTGNHESNISILNSIITSNNPPVLDCRVSFHYRLDLFQRNSRKRRELKQLQTRNLSAQPGNTTPTSEERGLPQTSVQSSNPLNRLTPLFIPAQLSLIPVSYSTPEKSSPKKLIKPSSTSIATRKAKHDANNISLTAHFGRQVRLNRYFVSNKRGTQVIVNSNRGIYACGMKNQKMNLGNSLCITEMYKQDLDMDRNQNIPPLPREFTVPKLPHVQLSLHTLRYSLINQSLIATPVPALAQHLLSEAQALVNTQFTPLNVSADLYSFMVDKFTTDVIVYENHVIAVIQYIFMRRYLWVESLAVDEQWKGTGLGKMLIERMKVIAEERGKEILLYALMNVVRFYEKLGFVHNGRFTEREYFIGRFLVWNKEDCRL